MILVYGFEPFKRYRKNITQAVIQALPEMPGVKTRVFPVRFDSAQFISEVEALQPTHILGLGQYPRGRQIRIERKAFNGHRHRKTESVQSILSAGPETQLVTWKIAPNSRMRVTYDAGRYVCNFSMYTLNSYALKRGINYAFLHIPRGLTLRVARAQVMQIISGLLPDVETDLKIQKIASEPGY